jgi:hypothetical protein
MVLQERGEHFASVVDNDLALVHIRPYDPTVTYVAKVEVQFTMGGPESIPLDPLPAPRPKPPGIPRKLTASPVAPFPAKALQIARFPAA